MTETSLGDPASAVRAAVTIASKRTLPAARVLARSFQLHHPGIAFLVVLADELDGEAATAEHLFEEIQLSDLDLPDPEGMKIRYSEAELARAIKPYALEWVLAKRGVDELVYLDPDSLILAPLNAAWSALASSEIVLIPHLVQPGDGGLVEPAEYSVLRRGVFDLGFLSLRRGRDTTALLSWWKEKLFYDCTIDTARGLYLDQRWMDLAFAYFPGATILRDPGYGVSELNLHERSLSAQDGNYTVGAGDPMTIFRFGRLTAVAVAGSARRATRAGPTETPALKALLADYVSRLEAEGFAEAVRASYAFDRLPNGVVVSELVRQVCRNLARAGTLFPSPFSEPDVFCAFICGPPQTVGGSISLMERAILANRPDVSTRFPDAIRGEDFGFSEWINDYGREEEALGDLADLILSRPAKTSVAAGFFARLRADRRVDVIKAYPDILFNEDQLRGLFRWAHNHGVAEHHFDPDIEQKLLALVDAPRRALSLYLSRPDLQTTFPWLGEAATIDAFCLWLEAEDSSNAFTTEEVEMFRGVAAWEPQKLNHLAANTNVSLREGFGGAPTLFDYCDPETELHAMATPELINEEMSDQSDMVNQARSYLRNRTARGQAALDPASAPLEAPGASVESIATLRQALQTAVSTAQVPAINIAGYFAAPTGVGEAARSMAAAAAAAGLPVHAFTVPSPTDQARLKPTAPFGRPAPDAALSISVINADMIEPTHILIPDTFRARRNVAMWFWETDRLPEIYAPAAESFDEIWVATEAVAKAVRATVNKPVRVIPLCLDFPTLDAATADRQKFGLPPEALVYSYFFDSNSIIARKNPTALLKAFNTAFGDDPSRHLLLKTNTVKSTFFALEELRTLAKRSNVRLIEETLGRRETYDLLMSADVYCSPHRFEGFGLSCAEAMALGKPVIATGYSGNLDFMTEENAVLIPSVLFHTSQVHGPYPAGTRWAEPAQEELVKALKALTDSDRRRALGAVAHRSIREQLAPAAVGARLKAAVDALV